MFRKDWWTDSAQHDEDKPRVLDVLLELIDDLAECGTQVSFEIPRRFRSTMDGLVTCSFSESMSTLLTALMLKGTVASSP